MGLFHHDSEESLAHESVTKHKADLSHELMSGAAAFAAAHEYEKHVAKNGKPPSHAKAKELLAGFSGAFIDREIETRGLNAFDKEKAKHEANKKAEKALGSSGSFN
ncbi:hypothetical protein BJ322DRAFT_1021890 [Thelephora terrestris]|uniref:Uncharacterized protein n=1 Tax=Thelephora terrestris TaxID=56493 RepID=A0A9P6HB60_9AGAM|nr:hypothetical protein BJ322DRAFT_1021890 [Thelephora terrestris]